MHVSKVKEKKNLGPSLLMLLPGLFYFIFYFLFTDLFKILFYFIFPATCFAVLTGFHPTIDCFTIILLLLDRRI